MPRFREVTAAEKGIEMANAISAFHVELIKQGIDKAVATELANKVAGSGSSNFDGQCGDLVRRAGVEVINPVR